MSERAIRGQRVGAALAWLVILGTSGFVVYRHARREPGGDSAWVVTMQGQGRYLVGLHHFGFPGSDLALQQARESVLHKDDPHNYSKRLRLAVLAGEVARPSEALEELADLEYDRFTEGVEPSPRSVRAARLLERLYAGYDKGDLVPRLDDDEQRSLREGLGWFGDLALGPKGGDPDARDRAVGPARRTVIGSFVVLLGGVLALGLGTVLFVVVTVLALAGMLTGGMGRDTGRGGVYAETFAAYMLLFIGISFAARYLPWRGELWFSGVAALLSLAALAWPVLRGVPWRAVRRDLGLSAGEQPALEVVWGVGTYLAAVPVLVVGLLVTVLLSRGRPPGEAPSHPLAGEALRQGWWIWVQIVFVASVVAPVVEEIMFRGALYRHLREATGGWAILLSVLASLAASSFIFAVIHPQGWMGVPVLGGLASVFALAREWRGSLVAPMIAHAINNGFVTLMLLLLAA